MKPPHHLKHEFFPDDRFKLLSLPYLISPSHFCLTLFPLGSRGHLCPLLSAGVQRASSRQSPEDERGRGWSNWPIIAQSSVYIFLTNIHLTNVW